MVKKTNIGTSLQKIPKTFSLFCKVHFTMLLNRRDVGPKLKTSIVFYPLLNDFGILWVYLLRKLWKVKFKMQQTPRWQKTGCWKKTAERNGEHSETQRQVVSEVVSTLEKKQLHFPHCGWKPKKLLDVRLTTYRMGLFVRRLRYAGFPTTDKHWWTWQIFTRAADDSKSHAKEPSGPEGPVTLLDGICPW